MQRYDTGKSTANPETGISADPSSAGIKSVLFVCWGNVCRSPAAAAVLKKYLTRRNLYSRIHIESAGVCVDEIPPKPSPGMRWTALRRGYRWKHEARLVRRADLNQFDLVIAMDRENLNALRMLHPDPKSPIKLLSDFLPLRSPRNVPDPMYQSLRTCNFVFDLLEFSCPAIASWLLHEGPAAVETINDAEQTTSDQELSECQNPAAD